MKTDVIALLREVNPGGARSRRFAREMATPATIRDRAVRRGEEELSRRPHPEPPDTSGRPLRRVGLVAVLGAGLVAAAFALLPLASDHDPVAPGGDQGASTFSDAFDALTAASAAAASGEPGEERFPYYVRLREHHSQLLGRGALSSRGRLLDGPRYVATETWEYEIWFRADGSQHVRYRSSGPRFPSPADRRLERRDRRSRGLAPPYPPASEGERELDARSPQGRADRLGYYGLEPADERLPLDTDRLAEVFASAGIGSPSPAARDDSRVGEIVRSFDFAHGLLLSVPFDEELRAAAYEVVANLEGVELDGEVRDPAGRVGTSVSFVAPPHRRWPGRPARYTLIFDPETGEPLAHMNERVDPRTDTGSPVVYYRVLLDAEPVDSVGQRPD